MILIEAGNTYVKAVKAEGDRFREFFRVKTADTDRISAKIGQLPADEEVVLCSVRNDATSAIMDAASHIEIKRITYKNLGSVSLTYDTPETLGIDRVIACLGAIDDATGTDVIVIDAGTACTIDYMTQDGVFMGGVIIPGLAVQRRGMRELLPQLPDPPPDIPSILPGKPTTESIQWGLYGGFLESIASFIRRYGPAAIYISGGDGLLISNFLKQQKHLLPIYRKELVFEGMRAWIIRNRL